MIITQHYLWGYRHTVFQNHEQIMVNIILGSRVRKFEILLILCSRPHPITVFKRKLKNYILTAIQYNKYFDCTFRLFRIVSDHFWLYLHFLLSYIFGILAFISPCGFSRYTMSTFAIIILCIK